MQKNIARAVVLMMDSFGIGGARDAAAFGDKGANTLLSLVLSANNPKEDRARGGLQIPNLTSLGLLEAAGQSDAQFAKKAQAALWASKPPKAAPALRADVKYGFMQEISKGKDTSSGHWEIMGTPVNFNWGYFPPQYPSFPKELTDNICQEAGLKGILGNKAASGTEIIKELGRKHIETGYPICYTSADSVFQIAAHEKYFGLERLYKVCEIAFKHLKPYNIARVIARPFEGEDGNFTRTKNRHDYSVPPPAPTVLDKLKTNGGQVISVGKINDIFAGRGVTKALKASGLEELWNITLQEVNIAPANSLIFTNFVDFDMVWGHRRNAEGYAKGVEYFDSRLPELDKILRPNDIVIITADHGCDPLYKGTDHTRENVPVLMYGPGVRGQNIGRRETFADIGQSLAQYFGLQKLENGTSFL